MRRFLGLTVLLFFAGCLVSSAQIQVELKLQHKSYLQFEQMIAVVKIYNDTSLTLTLDAEKTAQPSGLQFIVQKDMKEEVPKRNLLPMVDYLELKPGQSKEYMFDLNLWYTMQDAMRYAVHAQVYSGENKWNSNRLLIDVVNGLEITSVSKAIPGYTDRIRKFTLKYLTRDKNEHLFLKADEEAAGLVFVYPLGQLIRVQAPTLEVDRRGLVTVSHQAGRDRYVKSIFQSDENSVRFVDQQYFDSQGNPLVRKGDSIIVEPPKEENDKAGEFEKRK